MDTASGRILAAIVFLLAGCVNPVEIGLPDPEDVTWVAKIYSGGRQCTPRRDYTPPDVKQVLERVGVDVFDTAVESLAVCAACSCPAYAAYHYALVRKDQLTRAQQAGFEQRAPPAASGQGTMAAAVVLGYYLCI